MKKVSEKTLDKALEKALKEDGAFTKWFLSNTKFGDEQLSSPWTRSNHPWGRVDMIISNAETGEAEKQIKEGETDILVVFDSPTHGRFALHIENKLAAGVFTKLQPELYAARAAAWVGNPKYRSYVDFETILVAPLVFYNRNLADAKKFDRYISHEEISLFLPIFGEGCLSGQASSQDGKVL